MYGSNMFCHVALAREHFLAVGARNALNTAVLSLSHMNVPEEMITEKNRLRNYFKINKFYIIYQNCCCLQTVMSAYVDEGVVTRFLGLGDSPVRTGHVGALPTRQKMDSTLMSES